MVIHRFFKRFINSLANEENKNHQNIEKFLEYFGIEILRQDNFDIEFGDR